MAMTIKVNGAVFEFDEVSEYLEFAEATGLGGLAEEDSSGTPIKEPLGKDANGEDLYEGDYVTGTEASPYGITSSSAICEVESESDVKVIQTTDDDMKKYEGESFRHIYLEEFVRLSDNLGEAKAKYDELNGVELEDYPTEYRAGDIVRATEDVVGFGGQYVACNAGKLLEVQIGGTGALCLVKDFWKNAYVSENLANIELVCRREDRKDIEL